MGFFDIFKNIFKKSNRIGTGSSEVSSTVDNVQLRNSIIDIKSSRMPNGNLQVEIHEKNANFKKFYDTTKLIIGKQPLNISGHRVYNCAVSWYGKNDAEMFDPDTGKYTSRAYDYRGVFAEIDLELLQNDLNYAEMVMALVDQQRVERYLGMGLQETPEIPCGKYIGGIEEKDGRYGKIFYKEVGEESHNSNFMVDRRQQHREMLERNRQATINEKRRQIEKLQSEVDAMDR